jgi:predicted N-acetyltransferase YhbS/ubiquinone/menaquinone biosynthesis C-methylase UbiE
MSSDPSMASHDVLFDLHHGLPRQGPGSDETTSRLLALAGPLPPRPRILDLGCGPGRSALVLAAATGGHVVGLDLHQPYLDQFLDAAGRAGVRDRVSVMRCSMDTLPFPDRSFDLVWCEGAAYTIGFATALDRWRRLLTPTARLVVTELELTGPSPAPATVDFWERRYPLRSHAANRETTTSAGYTVVAHHPLPESDWWTEYYDPLLDRLRGLDPTRPGAAAAAAETRAEIDLRRHHGGDYTYAGYVLRPTEMDNPMWTARPETPDDVAAIRAVNTAAFPTAEEADLVDALRADPRAWIDGLSIVAENEAGEVVGYALLTRCHVGGAPALALAPCAVLPDYQSKGAGSAAIRAGLDAARRLGEPLVVVLGHPAYYPRFGFTPASGFGIRAPFEAPDDAFLALSLDAARPTPTGLVEYPPAFGV